MTAATVAVGGARPYAGSWNDGSRLAAAESLVDGRGWAIDDSIFVLPFSTPRGAPPPYPPSDRLLSERGTLDRLFIDGHFVSDKTPTSTLFLAGEYWLLQRATGIVARVNADRFCYWLTVFSSGLAFVAAIGAMFVLAWRATHSTLLATLVAASFGFSTCAAAYSRHVNSHVVLLAVFTLLLLHVDRAARDRRPRLCTILWMGTLAGWAYGFDAALGPIAVLLTGILVAWQWPSRLWLFTLAAVPWVVLQHALNWRIGGSLAPPNSIAAYLTWPGSPFDAASMTGRYTHESVGHAMLYAIDLLVGRRGFLIHNLPLLLSPVAMWHGVRTRDRSERSVAVFISALCIGGWLAYAIGSSNRSGVALSIRWFLPLLAPLFYLLARYLHRVPTDRVLFTALSAAGLGMGACAWITGPWEPKVPFFWWWLALALILSAIVSWQRRRHYLKS